MDDSEAEWLGPGEIARRLGLTRKALRVYEQEGLVAPRRLESGWRVYGPEQAARLHQIVVLRDLGIPLRSVKKMIDSAEPSLPGTLAMQRDALTQQQSRISQALALIEKAQSRLSRSDSLSLDDLINLTRETTVSNRMAKFEERLEGVLAERDPSGESMRRVKELQNKVRSENLVETLNEELKAMLKKATRLRASGDFDSEEAQDMVTHWRSLTAKLGSELGDKSLMRSAYQDTVRETPPDELPFDPADIDFLRTVGERMRAREAQG